MALVIVAILFNFTLASLLFFVPFISNNFKSFIVVSEALFFITTAKSLLFEVIVVEVVSDFNYSEICR